LAPYQLLRASVRSSVRLLCFLLVRRRPRSTLFPYTTLFRSLAVDRDGGGAAGARRARRLRRARRRGPRLPRRRRDHASAGDRARLLRPGARVHARRRRPHRRPGHGMTERRTVVVAGASGWIGRYLTARLRHRGAVVRTVGRHAEDDGRWSDAGSLRRALAGADLLVNLAGRSVSCRYSKRNADEIFRSRVETTAALADALRALGGDAPPVWLNASTGTIY